MVEYTLIGKKERAFNSRLSISASVIWLSSGNSPGENKVRGKVLFPDVTVTVALVILDEKYEAKSVGLYKYCDCIKSTIGAPLVSIRASTTSLASSTGISMVTSLVQEYRNKHKKGIQ